MHPDDLQTMYTGDLSHPELEPESIGLWEQYTEEYLAEMTG